MNSELGDNVTWRVSATGGTRYVQTRRTGNERVDEDHSYNHINTDYVNVNLECESKFCRYEEVFLQ